jgi:hypothetical protein
VKTSVEERQAEENIMIGIQRAIFNQDFARGILCRGDDVEEVVGRSNVGIALGFTQLRLSASRATTVYPNNSASQLYAHSCAPQVYLQKKGEERL